MLFRSKIGAIASMIHPLSPAPQINMYLKLSNSQWALTLDAFFKVFNEGMQGTAVKKLILATVPDYLSGIIKPLFKLTKGRKIPPVPPEANVLWYMNLLNGNHPPVDTVKTNPNDTSIILYSGGTTGVPKGIELTNLNMISEGMMVSAWGKMNNRHSVLAILPIFQIGRAHV